MCWHQPGHLRIPQAARHRWTAVHGLRYARAVGAGVRSALEVLAANGVEVMIAAQDEYTPTPAISHAILTYNRGRSSGLADGIVITPSHNPPDNGGFKYNPPNGGPADTDITRWIENRANDLLRPGAVGVKRTPYSAGAARGRPRTRTTTCTNYVADLGNILDMNVIRDSKIRMGVDPARRRRRALLAAHRRAVSASILTVVNDAVDPTFRFMTLGLGWKDPHGSRPRPMRCSGSSISKIAMTSPLPATPTMIGMESSRPAAD